MVLVLNGVIQEECPPDTHSLYHSHPSYRDTAAQLLSIPTKVVGPVGLLYIQQREFAATVPHDKYVSILGADNITTCLVVVLRNAISGAVALAHLDGNSTEDAICSMVQKLHDVGMGYDGRLELQLVGGYSDPRHYSEELFYSIMSCFHKLHVEFDVTLACVGELNTTIRGGIHWPIIYGVGVNVKTGEIFPANFPDKGPEQPLRFSRYLTGHSQVLDIYNSNLGLLAIGPFNYEPLRGVDLWLEQSDDFILQHLSTAPEVESPHFVMEIRAALKYIQNNQYPSVTVFRDNRPHYYKRHDVTGAWEPVDTNYFI